MSTASDRSSEPVDLDEVYRKLRQGLGHEFVNDDNVDALIQRAEVDGHTVLATELREWRAPC